MLLANSLSGIFGNHMSSLGLGSPLGNNPLGTGPAEETVINNYYGDNNPQTADDNSKNDGIQQANYSNDDDDNSNVADDQSDFGNDDSFDV
jgi:hypothetical protein